MGDKDMITAEGTFRYYDKDKKIIIEGKNFQKVIEGDEATKLFKKLVVVEIK